MKDIFAVHSAILQLAWQYGITTVKQLEVFLAVAQNEGKLIEEIWGVKPTDDEYKKLMGIIRKLMDVGYRYDGLELLQWVSKTIPGSKIKPIELSPKGHKLKAAIHRNVK